MPTSSPMNAEWQQALRCMFIGAQKAAGGTSQAIKDNGNAYDEQGS